MMPARKPRECDCGERLAPQDRDGRCVECRAYAVAADMAARGYVRDPGLHGRLVFASDADVLHGRNAVTALSWDGVGVIAYPERWIPTRIAALMAVLGEHDAWVLVRVSDWSAERVEALTHWIRLGGVITAETLASAA
jgi:hypothetical protein